MDHGGTPVSRAEFEQDLAAKLKSPQFVADIEPLLATGATYGPDAVQADDREHLIPKLPGDPWKGNGPCCTAATRCYGRLSTAIKPVPLITARGQTRHGVEEHRRFVHDLRVTERANACPGTSRV